MTPLALKVKYRLDTGLSPTYGKDTSGFYNYQGALTHEYAAWLEEYVGKNRTYIDSRRRRESFRKEMSEPATFNDSRGNLRYNREYKLWLEDLLCKTMTTLNIN